MSLADTELGPARIEWGGVDRGYTMESVTLTLTKSSAEKRVTQLGVTVIDRVSNGVSAAQVEVMFAEVTPANIATWAIETAVLGGVKVSGDDVGRSLLANAALLIIKPIVNGVPTANQDEWIQCPKASPEVDFSLGYDHETQRSIKVIFYLFPDEGDSFTLVEFGETAT